MKFNNGIQIYMNYDYLFTFCLIYVHSYKRLRMVGVAGATKGFQSTLCLLSQSLSLLPRSVPGKSKLVEFSVNYKATNYDQEVGYHFSVMSSHKNHIC